MSGKRKGGAEKAREKKRLLLLNASDKCYKLKDMFSKNSKLSNTPSTLKSDTNAVGQSNDRIVLNEIKDLVTVEKIYSSLSNDMFVDTSLKTMSNVTNLIMADKIDSSVSNDSIVPVHNNDPINQLPVNRLELRNRIRAGPYRPIMESYPKTMQGASERSFQKSWFEKYVWLEYSPSKDLAFCFPCRIFKGNNLNSSQLDDAFSKTGFCSWYRGINRFNKHQITKSHIFSTQAMADYLNTTSIDQQIDISRKEYISKCESDRLHNRKIMKRLIDITLCLVKGGRPFRGHDEGEKSNQKSLFKEIVNTFAKYEIVLKEHFENGPKNAKYTSNRIQNDLISSIHNVLIKKVKADLQNVYVSILADETSDVGHHEQLSIVIRYFDDQMNRPVETFLDLVRLVSVNAESIFTAISNIIHSKFGIGWSSIIAVCFDGASTMSGNIGEVQRKFKEMNANILYVHCYAHCLNLSLIDSITSNTSNKNQVVFNFLGSVQFLYSFIEGSPTRHAIFENIAKEHGSNLQTLKSCSTTRWACRSEAVNAIKHNYRALLKALDEITKKSLLPDVKMKGLGLLKSNQIIQFYFLYEYDATYFTTSFKSEFFITNSKVRSFICS
ncbi:zinc finger MYM-type protein 1-like [Rhopalosiphum maidis]|uniref:zinc finger MYM-type protein 1-like n=1 Tax=Rhopalosiphum maidis TaxID=43146 RepID=UPI000F007552|nr:zinc finger MYM-type protein 1-like [Rhopalosiphum maidis]